MGFLPNLKTLSLPARDISIETKILDKGRIVLIGFDSGLTDGLLSSWLEFFGSERPILIESFENLRNYVYTCCYIFVSLKKLIHTRNSFDCIVYC